MKGMTIIVKTIASWIKALVFLFGIYIILFGHLTPGGGFSGGVILAGSYILLLLAFGKEYAEKNLSYGLALEVLCLGTVSFIALALAGLFFEPVGTGFFWNFIYQKNLLGHHIELLEAGIIPLAEIAIGLIVGSGLFMIIYKLSTFRFEPGSDKEVS